MISSSFSFRIPDRSGFHIRRVCVSHSAVSNSLRPHGLQPARLLCPWNSLGKNTRVGCHSLLQEIFPTQGSNPGILHYRQNLYYLSHQVSSQIRRESHKREVKNWDNGSKIYFQCNGNALKLECGDSGISVRFQGNHQYHGDLSLCPDQQRWRSSTVLWRPTRRFRTNTQKRCPFHYGTGMQKQESRNTWSNRQTWPWSTEWSRAKANRVLPRKCTGHSKHPLPTTQEKTLHMDITRWSTPKSDWLYSLQPKMEKLYTVSKNKTGSWLWLRSWTPYCQIQTEIEESGENH